jgi:ubiquinone/menaquinone biosynthesis C-methylase UbiE
MAFTDPVKNLDALGLQEGMVVVDLGAGSGFYTLAAAHKVGSAGKVYAVDVQQDLLARIKNAARAENISNIEVIHGDVEHLGGTRLREKSTDAAIISNVFFQVEHKDDFLEEVRRIVKPHGKILFVEWADSFDGMGPAAEHIVTETAAKDFFEKHKFALVQSFNPGDHHYGLIYRLT